jgi:hypothetical protein
VCALAALQEPAHADETGRLAASVGIGELAHGPGDLDSTGFHFGAEFAYHLGALGPMVSFSLERFPNTISALSPTWFVSMGAGGRAVFAPSALPVALFVEGQGVVMGTSNPVTAPPDSQQSFVGLSGGVGVEWTGALELGLTAHYLWLADGPALALFSVSVGLGAP